LRCNLKGCKVPKRNRTRWADLACYLKKPDKRIVRYVVSLCLLAIGISAAEGFVFWHPLGIAWSIVVAVLFGVPVAVLAIRLGRSSGLSGEEITALQDKVLKAKDDPNEPARWVP
jgi:hypothetical protein